MTRYAYPVQDESPNECEALLRELDWLVRVRLRWGHGKRTPAWSGRVYSALQASLRHAGTCGVTYATPLHRSRTSAQTSTTGRRR